MSNNVAYIYESSVSDFHYGPKHPMKPHRIALTNSLVSKMRLPINFIEPNRLDNAKIRQRHCQYHAPEYLDSLDKLTFDTQDCPKFPGLYKYCSLYAQSSYICADLLNSYDIVINWSGGMHHAKKQDASGFCYVNDIVLLIQELLKCNERIMYIDIDIHHGDGVEEAFYHCDRVLTLSIHKFGDFFPGTGELTDIGLGKGFGYAVNIPLLTGAQDNTFSYVFTPIVCRSISRFKPNVIVMQCGADSLRGDRLGCFNLTIDGHSKAVETVKDFGIPLVILGGGGYNIKNVSRCWAYETAKLCGVQIPNRIVDDYYSEYYDDKVILFNDPYMYADLNSLAYLDSVIGFVGNNLDKI